MAEHVFETTSTETVYTGKILALRLDEVRMPGGNIARREVAEHYGAVAVVAMDDDQKIAMVYQYRHPIGRRLWELPAGLLDIGGEPPPVTAGRELQEEAGLIAQDWRVLVDLDTAPGFSDESVRVYLATELTEGRRPATHDEEADLTMQWFHISDAVQMVLAGEVVNGIAVAGILAAHAVVVQGAAARPITAPWIDKPTRFVARQVTR